MRGPGKRLILAALSLSVLAVFAWTIHTQPPAPATIRPARQSAPSLPKSEMPDLPVAPAVPGATGDRRADGHPADRGAGDCPADGVGFAGGRKIRRIPRLDQ